MPELAKKKKPKLSNPKQIVGVILIIIGFIMMIAGFVLVFKTETVLYVVLVFLGLVPYLVGYRLATGQWTWQNGGPSDGMREWYPALT